MSLSNKLNEFKGVITFVGFIIVSYAGIITWVKTVAAEEIEQLKAQSALIHDDIYLRSRIKHNELESELYEAELEELEEYIGDDEPTPREQRKMQYLHEEIKRLKMDTEIARENLSEKISHPDE